MKRSIFLTIAICSLSACGGMDPISDLDGDGISYEDEIAQGTDPDLMDSDGDGTNDGDEMLCGSDPMNADEVCYKCGWKRNDPGRLASTGSDIGDLIENVQMVDQCGEMVSIWDFYGEYHILYMTAAWWQGCTVEAGSLENAQQQFIEETGLGFSFLFALYEGGNAEPATAQDVEAYANQVGISSFPVFADGSRNYADATPMTQLRHPEMCAVSPEMRIISCHNGHSHNGHGGYLDAMDAIRNHAGL